MSFKSGSLAALLLVVLSSVGHSQEGSGPAWANYPAAEAWAEGVAMDYAAMSGNIDLHDAILNGEVNVFPGDPGDGNVAISIPGENGEPDIIVVQQPPNAELVGAGAVHEWEHLKNNHSRLPTGCDPNPDQLTEAACNECAAHCATLSSMQYMASENGMLPSCIIYKAVVKGAQSDCATCEVGAGVQGPPSQPACGGIPTVPCV